MRWLGRRPKVRGVAMNPCDHTEVVKDDLYWTSTSGKFMGPALGQHS
jgi:hypothetical protein